MYITHGQKDSLSHPATAQSGSPTIGRKENIHALGPSRSSHCSAFVCVADPLYLSTARWAPKPIHQSTAPPSVFPAVATNIVGQNNSGLSLINPKTTGSEPNGNRVALINDTTKTVLKPTFGNASKVNSCSSQISMYHLV